MPNSVYSKSSSEPQPQTGLLRSAWEWLTKPLTYFTTASSRQVRLLAWLLLTILLLTLPILLFLVIDNTRTPLEHRQYLMLILGLDILLALAYGLNCAGYYKLAAGLTVAIAVLGPWGSLILDPTILRGDFVPLAYTTLPVLLSSILLSPFFTTVLAVLQLAALTLIPFISPTANSINWPSFLALIFFIYVLSIISNTLTRHYLVQIDLQTNELNQSKNQLQDLSVRDHLTNLYNRRYLDEALENEIRKSLRSQETIGVILFDVDHFKQFNDRWGHAAGDVVLQQVGQLASTHIREGDIACRYGGEEFVLILMGATLEVTHKRAEQLQEKTKQLHLEVNGQPLGVIRVSMGVAMYPTHGSTREAILKSADDALYRAKSEGRDRVVVAAN